jgi:hypothetical protein
MPTNEKRSPLISTEDKIGIALALVGLVGGGALFVLPHPLSDIIGWSLIAIGAIGLVALGIYHVASSRFSRQNKPLPSTTSPKLDVRFEPWAPYQTAEISHGHTLSTVRIGLVSSDGLTITNCKVYVEKIAPELPMVGGLPILLSDQNFRIRHDDPETLVDIASHWDHMDKFRFKSPHGGFAETLNYIDDKQSRTIELRIKGQPEYEKSVTFRLWTDENRKLHMERL